MGGLSGTVHAQAGAGRHVLRRLPQSARQFPPLADPNSFCKRAKLLPMSFRPTRPVCIRARSCEVSRVRNVPPAAWFNESTDADPLQRAAVVPRVSCESDAHEQPRWSASCVSRLEKLPIPELHDLPPEDPRIQRGLYLRAMKHSLVLLFVTLSLPAQAPAPQPPNSQPAAQSGQTLADQPDAPRPELQPFTAPENPGVEPAPPIVEPSTGVTGSSDAGYRWISGVGGDVPTYRSTINLGEGPKLFGADFLLRSPKRRLYDRIGVRVSSVGGEPYSSVQINARRERTYETIFNYRNIAYYNFLPSFADPLASITGNFLDEQSRDLFLRNSSLLVNILPGRHFIPFFGYDRSSISGSGIVNIVQTSNEYPVLAGISDHLNNFRGGLR